MYILEYSVHNIMRTKEFKIFKSLCDGHKQFSVSCNFTNCTILLEILSHTNKYACKYVYNNYGNIEMDTVMEMLTSVLVFPRERSKG